MNNHINNKYVATGISSYNDSFWKAMRGSDKAYGDLIDGKHSLTNTYLLPESTATKYNAALKEQDLFRRIGTVMNAHNRREFPEEGCGRSQAGYHHLHRNRFHQ